MEICLRNTIHEQMSINYGTKWMTNGLVPLEAAQIAMIHEAKMEKGDDPDDLVAELKFAFWVGLLGPKYDGSIWRKALHRGFRVGGAKKRHAVHSRLNAIRRLRNRIAHHEPIFHRDTIRDHDEITEAIGWMCADSRAWAIHNSRVVAVYMAGVGD